MGNNYKNKYEIKKWIIHPEFEKTNDIYGGYDIAIGIIETPKNLNILVEVNAFG